MPGITTIIGIKIFRKAANNSTFLAVGNYAPNARWVMYWLQPQ